MFQPGSAAFLRDQLKLSVSVLKFSVQRRNCVGVITDEDIAEVQSLDGAPLAAFVSYLANLADLAGDDILHERSVLEVVGIVKTYLTIANISPLDYEAAELAYASYEGRERNLRKG